MKLPLIPPQLGRLAAKLPQYPHSLALAAALNLGLRSLFNDHEMRRVLNKVVRLNIQDAGLRLTVRIGQNGCTPCSDSVTPDATISAAAREFALLALRKEDPDTLFFDRRLLIEGDTELGLIVKNALDRVEPPLPASLLEAVRRRVD